MKSEKSGESQALSLLTKPIKPIQSNEKTTGGVIVKQERDILGGAVECQRGRDAEFLDAERQRMARVAAAARRVAGAVPPAACGTGIIAAPGRGPCVVVPHLAMVPHGTDARGQQKWTAAPTGYGHGASVRAADVFDRMLKAAAGADREPPFSPGQVAMARRYRALVERHDAGGVKCSALDGRTGGGAGRDFMDAYLDEGREIEAIRRRIGTGASMAVRRIRPSARGGSDRRAILDLSLVDMVCLGDHTLSEVLRAHGWATFGDNRRALAQALGAALDRMIGYRGQKSS